MSSNKKMTTIRRATVAKAGKRSGSHARPTKEAPRLFDDMRQKPPANEEFVTSSPVSAEMIVPHVLDRQSATWYGTRPLRGSMFTMRDRLAISIQRDADKVDPRTVKLLRPYLS